MIRRKRNKFVVEGDVAKIYFTNCDDYFLCDADMVEKLIEFTWFKNGKGYAQTNIEGHRKLQAHVFIMGKKEGLEIDHINRNRVDNRRCNLRHVTHLENIRNVDQNLHRGSNPATGVYELNRPDLKKTRYVAYIHVSRKKINLGSYDTLEEALRARKEAETFYWGKQA